jgi:hypothetical protein
MFITLITFLLGILVDSLQSHVGVSGWALWVDEAAAAIAVGFIVFAYERRREKALLEKLKVIELMNHHVAECLAACYVSALQQGQRAAIQHD